MPGRILDNGLRSLRCVSCPRLRSSRGQPTSRAYIRSYVFIRFSIGLVGVLLPPLLVFLEPALFDGQPFPLGSLSAYYYSGVRELFVGGLWAIGVFLFVYKFLDFSWESFLELARRHGRRRRRRSSRPSSRATSITPTPFQVKLGEPTVTAIHYGAAIAFIALLIPIVLFFARDEGQRGHRNWQGFHTVSATFIAFGAVLAAFAGITRRAGQRGPVRRVDRDLGLRRRVADEGRRVEGALPAPAAPSVVAAAPDPPESPVVPEG